MNVESLGTVLPSCRVYVGKISATKWDTVEIDYNPLYIGECMRRRNLKFVKVKVGDMYGFEYWQFMGENKPAQQTSDSAYVRAGGTPRVKPSPTTPAPRKPSPKKPTAKKKTPAKKTPAPRNPFKGWTGDAIAEYALYHPTERACESADSCEAKIWINGKETTLSGLFTPESIGGLILKGAHKTAWVKHAGVWSKWRLNPDSSATLDSMQKSKR